MAVAAARLRDIGGSLAVAVAAAVAAVRQCDGGGSLAAAWRRRGGGGSAATAHSAAAAGDRWGEGKGDQRSDGNATARECAMVTRRQRKAGQRQRYRDQGG